jgi:cytidylate kinase
MIITIGSLPGAGSTTAAREIAKKLGYKLFTVGEMHKKVAAEEGISSAELEKMWEMGAKNPAELKRFHNALDKYQKDAARKNKNAVFNGKLSAFQIPWAGLKVFLIAPIEVRAERVAGREKMPVAKALRSIKEREEWERKEWQKIYGFDYAKERDIYDLIINTAHWNVKQIARIVEMAVQKRVK